MATVKEFFDDFIPRPEKPDGKAGTVRHGARRRVPVGAATTPHSSSHRVAGRRVAISCSPRSCLESVGCHRTGLAIFSQNDTQEGARPWQFRGQLLIRQPVRRPWPGPVAWAIQQGVGSSKSRFPHLGYGSRPLHFQTAPELDFRQHEQAISQRNVSSRLGFQPRFG
jgi:hypothetical protein